MRNCTQKILRALAFVLIACVLLGGLPACSTEEIRRTLPAKRSF